MTRTLPVLAAALSMFAPAAAGAQEGGLEPASLTAPLGDSWPTYSGDYTGRRYSKLTQVTTETVKHLTLAWTVELNTGMPPLQGNGAPDFIGGEGAGEFAIGSQRIKGAILQVGDLLFVTAPDHVWALDVRDGSERWHYFWKTRGGPHIGNRGVAVWRDSLFFETVDNYLVALDVRTGEERWHTEIASFEEQYFSTMAPIVVGDHLLVGTGNDLDAPGFLQSFDPASGERQWIFYTVPMKPGDRPGHGDVAEPGCGLARRRTGLGARGVRPGDQLLHLRHREPDARIHRGGPARRQPVHLHADRGRCGDTARWPGISRPRRTTRTTGTPPRPRS